MCSSALTTQDSSTSMDSSYVARCCVERVAATIESAAESRDHLPYFGRFPLSSMQDFMSSVTGIGSEHERILGDRACRVRHGCTVLPLLNNFSIQDRCRAVALIGKHTHTQSEPFASSSTQPASIMRGTTSLFPKQSPGTTRDIDYWSLKIGRIRDSPR